MSQIGTLVTGAGVPTVIAGQSQCPAYLVIGTVDTPNALRGLTVEVDGSPFIQLNSAALINAFGKWLMEVTIGNSANCLGYMLKIATGSIKRNTTIRLTNDGVTVPAIFGFSDGKDGVPIQATTKTVNAQSYEVFRSFSALILETPANVSNAEIVFADGHKDTLTPAEIEALFALKFQNELGGIGTTIVIDNSDQSIQEVKLNTNSGGACTVAVVKIPDAAFKAIQSV
jgi:hypothetical protein